MTDRVLIGECEKCGQERFLIRMHPGQVNSSDAGLSQKDAMFSAAECGCDDRYVSHADFAAFKAFGREESNDVGEILHE